jgi:hypothetical protein
MQNKKMTNPTDGINESNKKLRSIYDQLCCVTSAIKEIDVNVGDITVEVDDVEELLQDILDALNASGGSYNNMDSSSLAAAGTLTFVPGDVHSFSWELGLGATIQINTGTSTNTFSNSASISFSTLNAQTITITAVGGIVNVIYIY